MEYKVPDVLGSMWLSDTCLPAFCAHCGPTALAMGLLTSLTFLCWEYRIYRSCFQSFASRSANNI